MTLKCLRSALSIVLVFTVCSFAAPAHHEEESEHHFPHHHSSASSYMHFHGPVEGPEFEVKVPYIEPHHHHMHSGDEHLQELHHNHEPHYVMDYVAHPKYKFSYGVEDFHTGDFHSQKESRDGSSVTGEYSVAEPGGGIRVVTYRADKDGFHAVVQTHGKNDHDGATYSYQGHESHLEPAIATPQQQQPESNHEEQQHQQYQQKFLHEYSATHPVQEDGNY